jgi:hypothetical protein
MNDQVSCLRAKQRVFTFVLGCAFYCCGGVSALPSGGGRGSVGENSGAVLLA